MGKDKKFIDAGKNVASSIFQKRNDYEEAHKAEKVVIEEVEEEKKLISSNNFGNRMVSDDVAKHLGLEKSQQLDVNAGPAGKAKQFTKKEIEEEQQIENEKIDIFAGIMTRGGELKPSLIKENEPEEIPEVQEEEVEEIEPDYSYDVTSQFYTKAIKPIDKDPKK